MGMNLQFRGRGRMAGAFSTAVLFCAFALLSLSVLLFGAKSYRAVSRRMDQNFTCRTAAAYISNKVRQYDVKDSVFLSQIQGIPALALTIRLNGGDYQTLIYCSGGAIRELFAGKDAVIDPDSGMEIVKADGLSFEERDGGIAFTVSADGTEREMFLALRSSPAE